MPTEITNEQDILDRAGTHLASAGAAGEQSVRAALARAPHQPSFWDGVGDALQNAGAAISNTTGEVVFPPAAADPQDDWIPVSLVRAQLLTVLTDQSALAEPSVDPMG